MGAMASSVLGWVIGNVMGLLVGGYVMYRWPQIGDMVETGFNKLFGIVKKQG